jgi:hypothetical protein
MTQAGNKEKPLNLSILKKVVICYQFRPDIQTMDTKLDTQPTLTPTQQRLMCALKKAGCCCLNYSLQNQLAMCKSSVSCA